MADKKGGSKFDINRIVENIRQVIPSNLSTPDPVDGDKLGESLQKLSEIAKGAAKQHAELTQQMYDLEKGINSLFADIEQLRKQCSSAKPAGASQASSAPAESSDDGEEETPKNTDDD